jgi:tetratricopeptide (TPR) repeat protein
MQLAHRNAKVVAGLWLVGVASNLLSQDSDRASKIYADTSKSVFLLAVRSGTGDVIAQGAGFLVQGGRIVTNEHVVRDGNVVVDLGTVRLPVTVDRVDSVNDLALLTAGAELAAKPLVLADNLPSPGASIYTIGNPQGLQRSISTGVVSGIRELKGRQLLQISSPISPGSSGGPVFNASGQVIGVAVGMLESGQNLNFAVPAGLVRKLMSGEASSKADVPSMLVQVDSLLERRSQYQYSAESDSDWQKLDRQIDALLHTAMEEAGNDPDLLLKIATKAEWQSTETAISAAERAIRIKPTAEGSFVLGKSLRWKAFAAPEAEKPGLLDQAEKALRSALRTSKEPATETYFHLGGVLEDRGSTAEAEWYYKRAFASGKANSDLATQASSSRGLMRTAYALGKPAEGAYWFNTLVTLGEAGSWDWQGQGDRLKQLHQYKDAGESYQRAASLGGAWTSWCDAMGAFAMAPGTEDSVLVNGRKCISQGVGKQHSEVNLTYAHIEVATVLNQRGVYEEALSHGREAVALDSSNAFAYDALAEALLGLRRFQEAINAAKQAVRLSDGKYAYMHFKLGFAYFEVENWEFSKQSYAKASELDPSDSTAPYNLALCELRLGYRTDAARWFEEVLRRNPNHPQKQEILNRIRLLRQ